MIFLAKLKNPHFSPGPESSECQLFELDDIPFDSLAFSSMLVSLNLVIFYATWLNINFTENIYMCVFICLLALKLNYISLLFHLIVVHRRY